MKREPKWIAKQALLLLRGESLNAFGGAPGLRDEGLLDSALDRARNRFHYHAEVDLAELAAAYGFGLAKNRPFVDGNKRAAFLGLGLFLAINGRQLRVEQLEAIATILALAAGDITEAQLAQWIRAHVARR